MPPTEAFVRKLGPRLGLFALLILGWLVYRPGLQGEFLFDDFVNLSSLGSSGPINDWPGFWRYITSGTADPTGRPLSLLSFLFDARDWPADPGPFLRTNILLHLLNGVLLFELLRRLIGFVEHRQSQREVVALLATGLWLLHPLLVSTTLYVVQREAMLPTIFVLLGLLMYTIGRMRLASTDGQSGTGLMLIGLAIGTGLAVLCKANGVLLPLLAWVLEATLLKSHSISHLPDRARRQLVYLRRGLIVAPSLLVIAYVSSFLLRWNFQFPDREWTIGQRVLSEPRIIIDYLHLLAIPTVSSAGLYNDSYIASLGLFDPISTFYALLAIVGLFCLGVFLRNRHPVLAAAILFFFVGHLLESTAVPLELYFEHRNYMPSLLFFLPVSYALCNLKWKPVVRIVASLGIFALFAITTWQRVEIWAEPARLQALWLKKNPDSPRAVATAVIELVAAGRPDLGRLLVESKRINRPNDAQLAVNFIDASCAFGGLAIEDKHYIERVLREADGSRDLVYRWLDGIVTTAQSGTCIGLTIADVDTWVSAVDSNPILGSGAGQAARLEQVRGRVMLARRNPVAALEHFNQSLRLDNRPEVALRQAAMLASAGYNSQGLELLNYYETIQLRTASPSFGMPWIRSKLLAWQGYWPSEIAWMRGQLSSALEKQNAGP